MGNNLDYDLRETQTMIQISCLYSINLIYGTKYSYSLQPHNNIWLHNEINTLKQQHNIPILVFGFVPKNPQNKHTDKFNFYFIHVEEVGFSIWEKKEMEWGCLRQKCLW
jgi:hypothetical protein